METLSATAAGLDDVTRARVIRWLSERYLT